MEQSSTDILTLIEVTTEDLLDVFGDLPTKDKIYYDDCPRKRWFLFGNDPYVGHASIVPIGPKLPSNSYRGGGFWMHPDHRSKGVGLYYACDIFRYSMSLMTGPICKIWGRTYSGTRLLDHYVKHGWQLGKEFKGGFTDMYKFLELIDCKIYQHVGDDLMLSDGIMLDGDCNRPFPIVIER